MIWCCLLFFVLRSSSCELSIKGGKKLVSSGFIWPTYVMISRSLQHFLNFDEFLWLYVCIQYTFCVVYNSVIVQMLWFVYGEKIICNVVRLLNTYHAFDTCVGLMIAFWLFWGFLFIWSFRSMHTIVILLFTLDLSQKYMKCLIKFGAFTILACV